MTLNPLLLTKIVKKIKIKDGVLTINESNSKKEFQISEIHKAYIQNRKTKLNWPYFISLFLALISICYYDIFEILIIITILITTILVIVDRFTKYKTLLIILKNNSIYSFRFNSQIKEDILKIIWEIRNFQ